MEEVIFDGKWTFFSEWKQSSYNVFSFDDRSFNTYVRTAHLGEHIYVFIDPIHDLTLDNKNDQAMICIDGKNEKILLQMKMIFVLLQF